MTIGSGTAKTMIAPRSSWALGVTLILVLSICVQREAQVRDGLRGLNIQSADFALFDFVVYYLAGDFALTQRSPQLYYPTDDGRFGNPHGRVVDAQTPWASRARAVGFSSAAHYIYPPFFALLMAPLTRLPVEAAYFIWREINIFLLLLSVWLATLCVKTANLWPSFVVLAIASLCFYPYVETLYLGQVDVFILFLWTAGVYFLKRKLTVWSALCFALSTMIKVVPIIVVPLFIIRKQWRWVWVYSAWCLLFLWLSIWRLGWENHVTYFSKVLPAMSCGYPKAPNNTLSTLIQCAYLGRVPTELADAASSQASLPGWICGFCKILGLAIYAGTLAMIYRARRDSSRLWVEIAFLTLVVGLISPIVWRHSYVITLLPLIFLWAASDREYSTTWWVVLTAATLSLGTIYPQYALVHMRPSILQLPFLALMPAAAACLLVLALKSCATTAVPSFDEL